MGLAGEARAAGVVAAGVDCPAAATSWRAGCGGLRAKEGPSWRRWREKQSLRVRAIEWESKGIQLRGRAGRGVGTAWAAAGEAAEGAVWTGPRQGQAEAAGASSWRLAQAPAYARTTRMRMTPTRSRPRHCPSPNRPAAALAEAREAAALDDVGVVSVHERQTGEGRRSEARSAGSWEEAPSARAVAWEKRGCAESPT